MISNRSELVWHGWPMLLPYARAVKDGGAEYLVGGLFPMRMSTNPPPAELFAQINDRTNLVYYDWEITAGRRIHAEQLQQLWDILNQRRLSDTNALDQRWLTAVGATLGNTITEVTLTSPKELTLVRKSDCGFTGFELTTLARWLISPGFPWTFEPPPLLRHRPPGSKTNAPPAAKPAPPGVK